MVDVDSAKSKRDFKRMSNLMLDKEKRLVRSFRTIPMRIPLALTQLVCIPPGFQSIEELEAPCYKRNHSLDRCHRTARRRERTSREANLDAPPGTLKRMQFTFSVDQPTQPASATPVQKPDLKPSAEFKDNVTRRSRPITRSTATQEDTHLDSASISLPSDSNNDTDTLNHCSHRDTDTTTTTTDADHLLRFPSIFSNDFGPSAILYPAPTVTNPINYGEGVCPTAPTTDSFDIVRPTIELPLDELLTESSAPRHGLYPPSVPTLPSLTCASWI
jgi:GATA-binding protein, other eukaryote